MEFNTILVLCTANICRSPMAEALLKQSFPDKQVISAGIHGFEQQPADLNAIELMQEMNLDISRHRSQPVTQALLAQADLIFVMTKAQLKSLEKKWPFVRGKAYLLGHWQQQEVPDPYQQPKTAFIYARDLMITGVKTWQEKLAV